MKKRAGIIGVVILALNFAFGQDADNLKKWVVSNTIPMSTLEFESDDFSDLSGLKEILKEKRIVLLGEKSHGGGSTFKAKVRLIKFLHEELGYNVLSIESALFDCNKAWQLIENGMPAREAAAQALFFMYHLSQEIQPLYEYMDEQLAQGNPLVLTGGESQHSALLSQKYLLEELKAFIEAQGLFHYSAENWKVYSDLNDTLFTFNRKAPEQHLQRTYFETVKSMKKDLIAIEDLEKEYPESSEFWIRVISSLETMANNFWQGRSFPEDMTYRDNESAANNAFLIDNKFKNEKIIVWAHNIHLMRKPSKLVGLNSFNNFGSQINQKYGDEVYNIATISLKGEHVNFINMQQETLEPASEESIEYLLDKAGIENGILDLSSDPNFIRRELEIGYSGIYKQKVFLNEHVDALLFISQETPVTIE